MSAVPLRLRPAAVADARAIAAHYRADSGLGIALAFADALDRAVYQIGQAPTAGAQDLAQTLGLPGLRSWPLRRFPHLVFYLDGPSEVDIWRILHGRRDVADWLRASA